LKRKDKSSQLLTKLTTTAAAAAATTTTTTYVRGVSVELIALKDALH